MSNYFPYGLKVKEGSWSATNYQFAYNGKQEEVFDKNFLHYGARTDDLELTRFISPDPLERKYPSYSPYIYVANKPIVAIDIKGEELFILFSTSGHDNQVDDVVFESAMNTRKRDIESSPNFRYYRDKVLTIKISDMSEIKFETELAVMKYSKLYGSTREVGVFSHAGLQGPIGSEPVSDPNLAIGYNQLKIEGWENIKYNWSENYANITFYGCNTANSENGINKNFALKISSLKNYVNVQVSGQPNSSYPSFSNVERTIDLPRTFSEFNASSYTEGNTYMVSAPRNSGYGAILPVPKIPALKLNSYMNGKSIGSGNQTTTDLKPVIPEKE